MHCRLEYTLPLTNKNQNAPNPVEDYGAKVQRKLE